MSLLQGEKNCVRNQDILDKAKELTEGFDDEELKFETWRGKLCFHYFPLIQNLSTGILYIPFYLIDSIKQ